MQYLTFANFGYVLAIPVMVDYVSRSLQSGAESYFFIITITNAISAIIALFIGAYSDFYSRRSMLITSMFLKLIAWILFLAFPHFATFSIGFAMIIFGKDMCNTTACLYETMAAAGDEESYRKEEEKRYAYPQYGLMIGLPIAGLLYAQNPAWPFVLNMVIAAIGIITAYFYTEAAREKTRQSTPLALLADSLLFLKNTHRMRWMTLYKGLMLAMMSIMIFVLQAGFLEVGGNITTFSFVIIGIYFIRAVSTQQAEKLFKYFSHPLDSLVLILIGSCIFVFLIGLTQDVWTFTIITFIYMIFRGLQKPCLNFIHNDLLTSDKRATAFAASALSMRFGKIIFNFIAGVTIASYGVGATLMLIALSAAIIGGSLLWLLRKAY